MLPVKYIELDEIPGMEDAVMKEPQGKASYDAIEEEDKPMDTMFLHGMVLYVVPKDDRADL